MFIISYTDFFTTLNDHYSKSDVWIVTKRKYKVSKFNHKSMKHENSKQPVLWSECSENHTNILSWTCLAYFHSDLTRLNQRMSSSVMSAQGEITQPAKHSSVAVRFDKILMATCIDNIFKIKQTKLFWEVEKAFKNH